MTRLLLGAVLLGFLGFSVSGQEMLAPPAQVRFDSRDYRNVLQWKPSTNTSLLYTVQWKIYGEQEWLNASSCQETLKRQCDLSSVTSDSREWYYARVRASSVTSSSSSGWALSPRFSPRWDTKISPPSLRLTSTKRSMVVQVKPPRVLLRKMHSGLHFKIFLIHASGEEEELDMVCCSGRLTLSSLKPRARYCLQAQTIIPLQAKSSARSALKCSAAP
ncbi:interleukin-22 receptor subunit alpha-2 [Cololabis saira]|uniref:interleukin-22 receptor subunit alpha-2 n=1 Tax=Cololabis saira TaxID=129043 RepID=UPI002AD54101|nr:interleukin-22 receptor subunit alpha-2 [Cololabis saira]